MKSLFHNENGKQLDPQPRLAPFDQKTKKVDQELPSLHAQSEVICSAKSKNEIASVILDSTREHTPFRHMRRVIDQELSKLDSLDSQKIQRIASLTMMASSVVVMANFHSTSSDPTVKSRTKHYFNSLKQYPILLPLFFSSILTTLGDVQLNAGKIVIKNQRAFGEQLFFRCVSQLDDQDIQLLTDKPEFASLTWLKQIAGTGALPTMDFIHHSPFIMSDKEDRKDLLTRNHRKWEQMRDMHVVNHSATLARMIQVPAGARSRLPPLSFFTQQCDNLYEAIEMFDERFDVQPLINDRGVQVLNAQDTRDLLMAHLLLHFAGGDVTKRLVIDNLGLEMSVQELPNVQHLYHNLKVCPIPTNKTDLKVLIDGILFLYNHHASGYIENTFLTGVPQTTQDGTLAILLEHDEATKKFKTDLIMSNSDVYIGQILNLDLIAVRWKKITYTLDKVDNEKQIVDYVRNSQKKK